MQASEEEGEDLEPDDSDGDEEDVMDQLLDEQIQRPLSVDDGMAPTRTLFPSECHLFPADWRLYRAIALLKQEFGEKFHKIFA